MPEFEEMAAAMKKAAGALRDAEVRFVLGGGLAAWARGAPFSDHDVDFLVKPEDTERAVEALSEAGMRIERPPEGWLLKAYDDGVLVDVIFEPSSGRVTDAMIERAEEREVLSARMRVLALEDIMASKLLALNETHLDFSGSLEIARSIREQVAWEEVREQTKASPYARAFFTLVEELGIVEPASAPSVD